MADIRKGVLLTFGVVIALMVIALAILIAVRTWSGESLADCIAREYGITKDDFRMSAMMNQYTICHASRDGVNPQNSGVWVPAPTRTIPRPTATVPSEAYIECMNSHDDYLQCRCLLNDSAPSCWLEITEWNSVCSSALCSWLATKQIGHWLGSAINNRGNDDSAGTGR